MCLGNWRTRMRFKSSESKILKAFLPHVREEFIILIVSFINYCTVVQRIYSRVVPVSVALAT